MIVTPEAAPILWTVVIGAVLVIAIGVSGVAILILGPRRPSALVIPTIASLIVLVVFFLASRVVLGRADYASPLIAMVVAALVTAFLRRPRLDRS